MGSLARELTAAAAAATEVRDEVVLDEREAMCPLWGSDTSSTDVCSGDDGG